MGNKASLKNISESQKEELAQFAKSLLESTGVVQALSDLNQCVRASIGEESEEGNRKAYLLAEILDAYLTLNERAAGLGKSIYELTGVEADKAFFGVTHKEETK